MEQRHADHRQDEATGDYEYDQAHEQPAGGPPAHIPRARRASAPAARPATDRDGDMSYDEAHDF